MVHRHKKVSLYISYNTTSFQIYCSRYRWQYISSMTSVYNKKKIVTHIFVFIWLIRIVLNSLFNLSQFLHSEFAINYYRVINKYQRAKLLPNKEIKFKTEVTNNYVHNCGSIYIYSYIRRLNTLKVTEDSLAPYLI